MASANAMIIGSGTDRDAYVRGDRVKAFIKIKNTGAIPINAVGFTVSIAKLLPLFGTSDTYDTDFMLKDLDIKPGEAKDIEVSETIPTDFHGASSKGKYALKIKVRVEDRDIGSLNKTIVIS